MLFTAFKVVLGAFGEDAPIALLVPTGTLLLTGLEDIGDKGLDIVSV